ncbi:tetratricopeptide repeat protein [Pseudoduganella sp. RAF19]|uniref:tetratricopeptide repeat protein n=1 Tax=Pseudoduganella sp. RAF19 TaxID=3233052 RepID=UPI003F99454E
MANREELVIIRGARSGDASCQLALGKLYLFGGASLPRNPPTALHWLCRAAGQGMTEAWQLVGRHISFEHARNCRDLALPLYARAAAAGELQALLVLAELLLEPGPALEGEAEWRGIAHGLLAKQPGPRAQHLLARLEPVAAPAPPAPQRLADTGIDAHALPQDVSDAELARQREQAAQAGDRTAQLALGLALARMNTDGDRVDPGESTVNFKRALRWLARAGEQGLADAWFAMSRIYTRPEFSQRSLRDAQACLERAADMGHSGAQLECGIHAWRARRGDEQNDVKAAYWLQKAAAQGSAEAQAALQRIAPSPEPSGWAESLLPQLTRELLSSQPLLAARIELAAMFRLTRAEALLLDVKTADHGHCLVVDIRAYYGRSKRRLVLVRSAQQRQALDRIVRLFEQVDCSPAGPEGNYRQRLYRFKTWVMSAVSDELAAA